MSPWRRRRQKKYRVVVEAAETPMTLVGRYVRAVLALVLVLVAAGGLGYVLWAFVLTASAQ